MTNIIFFSINVIIAIYVYRKNVAKVEEIIKKVKPRAVEIRLAKLLAIKKDEEFKLQTGVKREVFDLMLRILEAEYNKAHEKGSNKGIGPGCRLVIALLYWREFRAQRQIAFDYDIALSTVSESIKWVEKVLRKHDDFTIGTIDEEIEKLEKKGIDVTGIIIDVEEQPIERPTVNQEDFYSGKKKRHTTKNQIIIEEKSKRIINIFNDLGAVHDYQMLKTSGSMLVLKREKYDNIDKLGDSGYQGMQNELSNAIIPIKKKKNNELTKEGKAFNKELSKRRIYIEHINRMIKIFRIMKETFRARIERYEDKLTIICCICNLSLI